MTGGEKGVRGEEVRRVARGSERVRGGESGERRLEVGGERGTVTRALLSVLLYPHCNLTHWSYLSWAKEIPRTH